LVLVFFFSSFLQEVLDEDVRHGDVLSKLRDVQVAFGIFFGISFKGFPIYFVASPSLGF